MTRTTRIPTRLGVVLAALLLGVSGCGGEQEASSGSGSAEEQTSQTPGQQPDLSDIPDVVAEVNGEEVTRDEFVPVYEAQYQQATMQAQMGGGQPADEEALQKQTADRLVDTELLRQEADERGIHASSQDVDRELAALAKQNRMGSAKEFLAALEKQGTSEELARSEVETQVVVERLVTDEAGSTRPSEQQLHTLYRQAKQQQAQQQQGGQQPFPPFAKVRDQLAQQAQAQEQGRVVQQLVGELRKDADITLHL